MASGQTECELMGFSLILYIETKWLDLYMYTVVPVHGDCTYLLNCIFYLILPTPCVCVVLSLERQEVLVHHLVVRRVVDNWADCHRSTNPFLIK